MPFNQKRPLRDHSVRELVVTLWLWRIGCGILAVAFCVPFVKAVANNGSLAMPTVWLLVSIGLVFMMFQGSRENRQELERRKANPDVEGA